MNPQVKGKITDIMNVTLNKRYSLKEKRAYESTKVDIAFEGINIEYDSSLVYSFSCSGIRIDASILKTILNNKGDIDIETIPLIGKRV